MHRKCNVSLGKGFWQGILCLAILLASQGSLLRAQELVLVKHTVSVSGGNRNYFEYVSTKSNSFNGQWVVFALHDNGQSATQFAMQSGWVKVAEDNGFAVVFPEAVNNTWASNSGMEDDYLKVVFDDVANSLISKFPGDNKDRTPTVPGNKNSNNPIWTWEPLRDLTGSGAGAVVAQEFAMNYPGLFAGVATLNGVAFDGAYDHGEERAQDYFQHMRSKNVPPVWKQLKKEVPQAIWMFHSGAETPAQVKQASYWKRAAAVDATPVKRTIGGFETSIYQNPKNAAEQVRLTQVADGTRYDESMASAIWNGLFAHVARWTSAPNGELATVLTEAEVHQQFDTRTVKVGESDNFQYLIKVPSSYRKGQKLPMVISLHGSNEQAWLFLSKIKFHELGEKEGFLTIYPMGHRNAWDQNNPDGAAAHFIEAAIKDAVEAYGVDPTRVYLQGFSNGGGMTILMAATHPLLFAAAAPTDSNGAFTKREDERVAELKAKFDYRIPVMVTYGAVDRSASVDGKLAAESVIKAQIDSFKTINHVATKDEIVKFNSRYTAPYEVVNFKGKLEPAAIDKHYPAGRFQVFSYMSADPKPLNLVRVAWILDVPHAYDLREARLQWDYFKHWSRNTDGSLTYSEK